MAQQAAVASKIRLALSNVNQGLNKDYDGLLHELSNPSLSDEALLSHLIVLKENVTAMGRKVEMLIGVLLAIKWTDRGKKTVREYQSFLLNVVSAHTYYLKAVLRMIVMIFCPGKKIGGEPEITEESRAEDNKSFFNGHTLLQAILQIVPMAPTVLVPLLVEKYPYINKSEYLHQCYVRNLLQIALYMPSIRPQLLEMIVENMTKLDVQCPRDKIVPEEEEEEEDIFDMEADVALPDDKLSSKMPPAANKLDLLMDVMFSHINDICYKNGQLDWEGTKKLYKEMLGVFNKILLPTYASSHVQFLMFYICSFKVPLVEGFLDYLWKRVQDPNVQPVFRQAAVAYIASLLARAKFIPLSTVRAALDLMVHWIHLYIQQAVDSLTHADIKIHGTFYAVCQALLYILAFRHKTLLESHEGLEYCQKMNLQTIVTCRLNPLKFCISIVVNTFSSIARQYQLAYCDTIIERNKRNRLPIATGNDVASKSQSACIHTLHSFFPFDPYLLPRSVIFIESMYREYEGITVVEDASLDNMEEDEYAEVAGSQVDRTEHIGVEIIKSPQSPQLTDFLMYSSSPGFQHA